MFVFYFAFVLLQQKKSTENLTFAAEMSLAVTFKSKKRHWPKYIPLRSTNEKNGMMLSDNMNCLSGSSRSGSQVK